MHVGASCSAQLYITAGYASYFNLVTLWKGETEETQKEPLTHSQATKTEPPGLPQTFSFVFPHKELVSPIYKEFL